MEHGIWKNKKGKEIFVEPELPQWQLQGNPLLSSCNEDFFVSRLRDMIRGTFALELQVAKTISMHWQMHNKLKILVHCVDN